MSPYYDQPGYRRTGPEDVAGVVVLLGCAVFGFLWYIAVSRLHLRNDQCLEIFLDCAIVFFGGGLLLPISQAEDKARGELAASCCCRAHSHGCTNRHGCAQ
jgi:hypothetical protein